MIFDKRNEDGETVEAVDGPLSGDEIKTGYDADAALEFDMEQSVDTEDTSSGTTALRMVSGASYSQGGYRFTLDDVVEVDNADVERLLSLRVAGTGSLMFERA